MKTPAAIGEWLWLQPRRARGKIECGWCSSLVRSFDALFKLVQRHVGAVVLHDASIAELSNVGHAVSDRRLTAAGALHAELALHQSDDRHAAVAHFAGPEKQDSFFAGQQVPHS